MTTAGTAATIVSDFDELGELRGPAPEAGTGTPGGGQVFAHWPLPVGLVETHDDLSFVYSTDPVGFSADDYRRIPGDGRIELLNGVVVVSPTPGGLHQRVARHLQQILDGVCPDHLVPFGGTVGIPLGPSTILTPDIQVFPRNDDPPVLVVEVLPGGGHDYAYRAKFCRYRDAGVASYWVVDPAAASIEIFEFGNRGTYRQAGSFTGDEVCAVTRPFPVRFRVSDLTRGCPDDQV